MKRSAKLETKKACLFLTKSHNRKFTYRTLLYYIKQYQQGLSVDFACHDFRRAFGTSVYNKTNDIVLAQQLLGHSSIETTRKYILGDTGRLEKFNQIDF